MEPLWLKRTASDYVWLCPGILQKAIGPKIIHVRICLSSYDYHIIFHNCRGMIRSRLWFLVKIVRENFFYIDLPANFGLHFKVCILIKVIRFTLFIKEPFKILKHPRSCLLAFCQIEVSHVSFIV